MARKEVRFNIVESRSAEHFNNIYEKVKEDIQNGMLVKDIMAKHNIGNGRWIKFRKQLIADGLLTSTQQRFDRAKYYYYNKHNDAFQVVRTIDHRKTHFTCCKTEDDAKYIVKRLNELGWDKKNIPKIKGEIYGDL